MATKKKSKKNANLLDQKIFGVDAKTLGAAIATAVVAEIAQNGISKATGATTGDDRASRVRSSVKDATDTVKAAVAETTPVIRDAVDTAREAVDMIKPAVAGVIDAIKDAPDAAAEAVEDTVDTAKETAAATEPIGGAIGQAVDQISGRTGERQAIGKAVEASANTVKTAAAGAKQSFSNTVDTAKTKLAEANPVEKRKKKKDKKKQKAGKKNKK